MGAFYVHPSRWVSGLSVGFLLLSFFGTFVEHRFAFVAAFYPQPPEALDQWMGQTRTLSGQIVSEVDRRSNRQEAIVSVDEGTIGRGLLVARLYPELQTGMKLKFRCRILPPQRGGSAVDDPHLRLKRVFWICRYPQFSIEQRRIDVQWKTIFAFKAWGLKTINREFPEPHASLLAGLLFGVRRSMPESFYTALQKTGTVHLIAISGYNVSLVLTILLGVSERLGFTRIVRLSLAGVGLIFFVVLTGASASVVRAAVMGGLSVLAITLGRKQVALHLLLVAACLMAIVHPLIVRYDVGFQLSFAATLGLILGSAWLEQRLAWVPEHFALRQTLAATLGANIGVTPLLIAYFGSVSIISVLENLLILPVIPWIMLGGSVFLGCAAVLPFASGWFALPTLFLLHGIVAAIQWGAAFPFAQWVLRSA